MPSEWNERLVISFLKAYKQYPCLWNPYHRHYYNCYEKNQALQRIIDDLGIPGFTITDYLYQIKSIKEKYKLEQIRTIQSLQSRKQYKSPFSWYNIMADMLAKVIDDEERIREPISIRRSLSSDCIKDSQREKSLRSEAKFLKTHPCTNITCDLSKVTSRRSKSMDKPSHCDGKRNSTKKTVMKEKSEKRVRYVPCPSYIPKKDLKDREEDELLSCRPTRDVEPEEIEYCPVVPSTSVDSKFDTGPPLTRENSEDCKLQFLKCPACGWKDAKNERRSYVPCSEYNKNLSGEYSVCVGCDKVAHDDPHYRSAGSTDLSEHSKKYNSGNLELLQWLSKHPSAVSLIRLPASSPVSSPVESVKTTENHADAEVQHGEDLKMPANDDVPTTASIQTRVVQVEPAVTHKLQFGTIKAQLELILSESTERSRPNELAESVARSTRSVQSAESPTGETRSSFESKKHEIGINTMDALDKASDDTVCVSAATKKCVSIQTLDEIERNDDTMKEVGVNVVDQTSRGTQSTICVSRGNSACHVSSEKKSELGTTTSRHQVRSVSCATVENVKEFRSSFVQCVSKEKLQASTRSESHDSVKHCIRDVRSKHFVERGTRELEDPCTTDTCPWNILHLSRNPIVAPVLQRLLQNILSVHEHRTQECEYRLKENCLIDLNKMVTAIQEYTKMLESTIIRDDLSEFSGKSGKKSSSEQARREPSLKEIGTCITRHDKSTMTEGNIFVPVLQSVFTRSDERQKTKKELHSMVDKKLCTRLNCKDVGVSGSLAQLSSRDMEVQGDTRSFKDSVCVAKYEYTAERVSVGTQKRDPILVRVIKCNKSQPIVRSDKGTSTPKTDMNFAKRYTSKRVEACGRSTCIPSTVCRMSNEANLKSAFREERENEMIDNCDICEINCKGNMSYDWTDVTNVDIFSTMTNLKIPVCTKSPRKYTYA